jgi:hypothetical protein
LREKRPREKGGQTSHFQKKADFACQKKKMGGTRGSGGDLSFWRHLDPPIPLHLQALQVQMDRPIPRIVIGAEMEHMSEEVWRRVVVPDLEEEAKKTFETLLNTEEWSKIDKDHLFE